MQFQRVASRIRTFVGTLWASAWAGIFARGVAVVLGLSVLAWLGRGTVAAPAHASVTPDAGVATLAQADIVLLPMTSAAAPSAPSPPPPPSPTTGHARATPEDPVYLNAAGVEDLRRLPGVGPKRADAILALRQRVGRFQRIEELLRVKGVGRTTLRKWRPLLRLDRPAMDRPDAGATP